MLVLLKFAIIAIIVVCICILFYISLKNYWLDVICIIKLECRNKSYKYCKCTTSTHCCIIGEHA